MTYLLDTHVVLWWLLGDRHLSQQAKGLIAAADNKILVSSVSAWEIAAKHRLGKLSGIDAFVQDIPQWVMKAGFKEMTMDMRHAQKAGGWAQDHRDPFDRMLAAQSAIERIPLISSDRALREFGIELVW